MCFDLTKYLEIYSLNYILDIVDYESNIKSHFFSRSYEIECMGTRWQP